MIGTYEPVIPSMLNIVCLHARLLIIYHIFKFKFLARNIQRVRVFHKEARTSGCPTLSDTEMESFQVLTGFIDTDCPMSFHSGLQSGAFLTTTPLSFKLLY